eukprot:CAMPEP_0184526602 /NCGR_PEP_ID=MMETSP0198_2-20121128/10744_1 /TAXON_ID=1112570 /ORGANISM="Thraustochytrium sp., Strain LLF1b" /LENGTH=538 /DNA_ID=CAMNT_0026918189 /DNA_START=375 /DNA_END=1988 /DNA_ORIENTATION=-
MGSVDTQVIECQRWLDRELSRRLTTLRTAQLLLCLATGCSIWLICVERNFAKAFAVIGAGVCLIVSISKARLMLLEPRECRDPKFGRSFEKRQQGQAATRSLQLQKGLTFFAWGTRGDVEPILVIASRLQQEFGKHVSVLVCGAVEFSELAKVYDVPYWSCGKCLRPRPYWFTAQSQGEFIRMGKNEATAQSIVIRPALTKACYRAAVSGHVTDVILAGPFSLTFGHDLAEALNIPCIELYFAPTAPTGSREPFGSTSWPWPLNSSSINKGRHLVRDLGILKACHNTGVFKDQNAHRREELLLAPIDEAYFNRMKAAPKLFLFSERVTDRPTDWPSSHIVTGYCHAAKEMVKNEKRRQLCGVDTSFFREEDPKPICVALGSMTSYEVLAELVLGWVKAVLSLRDPTRKCVVVCQDPGKNLSAFCKSNDRSLLLHSAQYDILFPKCALVVHHGGAGTTASVLSCGVPSIVVPLMRWYDQFGWATAVEKLGTGVVVNRKDTAYPSRLNTVLREVLCSSVVYSRARELRVDLSKEDGPGKA